MQRACAYSRKERIFVRAWSRTRTGMWIENGPCVVLSMPSTGEEVGIAVTAALARSQEGVAHPSREGWKEVVRPLLDAVGVKSWPTFSKLAKAVAIYREESAVTLDPLGRDEKGAYFPVAEREVRLRHDIGSAELGEAVLKAFAVAD